MNVVLVIDASTSMQEPAEDGRPKIEVAVEAARGFVEGSRVDAGRDRIAVVAFNETAETMQTLTDSEPRVIAALERIRTRARSRVDLGLRQATVELVARGRAGHVQAMIVLSDGRVNQVDRDRPGIEAEAAREAGIAVYVVGMGPDTDAAVLRAMAGRSDRLLPAPSPAWLRAIFADLTQRVPCPADVYWGRR